MSLNAGIFFSKYFDAFKYTPNTLSYPDLQKGFELDWHDDQI